MKVPSTEGPANAGRTYRGGDPGGTVGRDPHFEGEGRTFLIGARGQAVHFFP